MVSSDDEKKEGTSAESKRKYTGSFQYKVVFKESWKADYPIKAVPNDKYKFHCLPCEGNLSCHHQGLKDVKDHFGKDTHKMNLRGWKSQPNITSVFSPTDTPLKNKVLNAEVAATNFLVQHKLPLATADNLGLLFKSILPDSKIAQFYGCARQKTSAIINESFQPYCHNYLVEFCKNNPYSVGHDGSNDTGVRKMNPFRKRIFDIK